MLGKDSSLGSALLIAALGSLLVASCQSSDPGRTQLVEKEVTKQVEVTRVVVQEVEKTTVVEVTSTPTPIPSGGFLVTARGDEPHNLNPLLFSDDESRFISSFLYGSMLSTDPFTGELVCHFCQSWELVDRTYTFVLRDDLVWSDGEPVTADDFTYTYTALLWGAANQSLDSPRLEVSDLVESIAQLDERTVTVTMQRNECADVRHLNLGWLPEHRYGPTWEYSGPVTPLGPFGDADDPDFSGIENSEMNHAPAVSNGPFLLDEWVRDDHISLVRNPSYFRGAPRLDGLIVRLVPDEKDQVQMLRTGQVDLVEGFRPRFLVEIELMDQLAVYKTLADSYVYLSFQLGNPADPQPRWLEQEETRELGLNEAHGEHPILSDRRVRQAIALGVDRRAIVSQAELGQGVALSANLLPSLAWAYNDELEPRDYDPQKAAELLEEAGWELNGTTGIRERDGLPLQLSLRTNLNSDKRVKIGELIAEQLGQLGFDISFEALEWGQFVGLLLGQQFDLAVISWTNLGNSPDDSLFFGSENDVPGRGFNFVSYHNPGLDQMWRSGATVPGCRAADRGVVYRQIQAALYDELPYSWLYVPLALTGANRRLTGINPGPWSTWYNVETWYLAAE